MDVNISAFLKAGEEKVIMDIISAILEIDNTAKEMMKNAEEKRNELMDRARESEAASREDIMAAAKKETDVFEKNEKMNAEKEIDRIEQEKQKTIERLDRTFEENRGRWASEIFESIVG